jgi:L-iditol 2-dehydrogenase
MRAVVLQAPSQLTVTEVADPVPFGERPVLVRVAAVGVCGSDLLRYGRDTAYHYPLVLGHEFSAVVEQAPPGSALAAGDRVAVFPLLPDPADPLTEIGEPALGSGYDYFGSRRDGGFSDLLYVPERNLIPVPAGIPLLHAAMIEPAAVALHAVLKLQRPPGDTVAAVRERTGGVDAAVEASGLPQTLLQALEVTGPRGQVLLLGDLKGDVTIPQTLISSVIRRELVLYGTWNSKITPAGRSEWDMVVAELAGGRLQVAPLISHALPVDRAPQLFADLLDRREPANKVLFALSDAALAETTDLGIVPASAVTVSAVSA